MVKKPSGSINMAALDITEDDEKEKSFSQNAQLAERGNISKGGRPPKEDKADKPMTVYFTEAERETVRLLENTVGEFHFQV